MVLNVSPVGVESAWLHLSLDGGQPLLVHPLTKRELRWLDVCAVMKVADDLVAGNLSLLTSAVAAMPFLDPFAAGVSAGVDEAIRWPSPDSSPWMRR